MIKKISKITSYILFAALTTSLLSSINANAAQSNESSIINYIESTTGTDDISSNIEETKNYIAVSDGENSTIKIPRDSSNPITLTPAYNEDQSFGIKLPLESSDSNISSNGTVLYTSDDSSVSFGAQPIHADGLEGVRTLVTINDENASKNYTFSFDLEEGSKLVTDAEYLGKEYSTGEIFIVNNQNIITGIIDKPWAYDANGHKVSTKYKIKDENKLVQTINFSKNTTFPVVADPSAWQITKCAGSIAWALGSGIFAGAKLLKIKKYIKALGGVKEAAALLLGATTWAEKMEAGGSALVNLAAEISGVKDIKENCFS